jgi:hypothetical protein
MADDDDRNLRRELGVSRRELIRRGAIVGGTLLWAAPVIQSITTPAIASTESERHFCCFCSHPSNPKQVPNFQCFNDGFPSTDAECASLCSAAGFTSHVHMGPSPTPFTCGPGGCSH